MKILVALIVTLLSSMSHAAIDCAGKIENIYKWNAAETLSIRLTLSDGSLTNYVTLPGKSEESLALMAYASNQEVHIYMSESDVATCNNGWSHNRALVGYFSLK